MSDRIIALADVRGEFKSLDDGFVYYWPSECGAIAAHELRLLADELDRRNARWVAEIEEYFNKQEVRDDA